MPSDADYLAMAGRGDHPLVQQQIRQEQAESARRSGRKVYLCGGINGLSDADAKGWREEVTLPLIEAGWFVIDPMGRDYRGRESQSVRAIVDGDLFDIGTCDVLLVNACRASWGTAMEVMYAARCVAHRKRVVTFGAGETPSPWLVYHSDRLFATAAEAVAYLAGPG